MLSDYYYFFFSVKIIRQIFDSCVCKSKRFRAHLRLNRDLELWWPWENFKKINLNWNIRRRLKIESWILTNKNRWIFDRKLFEGSWEGMFEKVIYSKISLRQNEYVQFLGYIQKFILFQIINILVLVTQFHETNNESIKFK